MIAVQRFLNTNSGIVPGNPFLRGEDPMLPSLKYRLRVWRESFTPYSLSIWSHTFWADLPLGFFLSSASMVVVRLCEALACFFSIAVFTRCCCMPVVIFRICFIFGGANFTAGDGVDRDDIYPSMNIVELIINGGSGSGGTDCCWFVTTWRTSCCNVLSYDCSPKKLAARIAWDTLKPEPVTKNLAAFWTFAFWEVLCGILGVVWVFVAPIFMNYYGQYSQCYIGALNWCFNIERVGCVWERYLPTRLKKKAGLSYIKLIGVEFSVILSRLEYGKDVYFKRY